MEPIYIKDDHKEELDSDTYRITQETADLEQLRPLNPKLYLSALSPADIADFYWGERAVHEQDPVMATLDDFTAKEGGSGTRYCVVKRSEPVDR